MHALVRPHLPHAAAITAAFAVLAVVFTLLFAVTLSDVGSGSVSGASVPAPVSLRTTSSTPDWNLNPFTRLLRAPVRVPWTAGS